MDRLRKEWTSSKEVLVVKYTSLLGTFWASSIGFQRLAGACGVHSGRAGSAMLAAGAMGLSFCTLFSMTSTALIVQQVFDGNSDSKSTPSSSSTTWLDSSWWSSSRMWGRSSSSGDIGGSQDVFSTEFFASRRTLRQGYLTVGCFLVLEQVPFPFVSPLGTLLPSSLLDVGVFARSELTGGSIPSTAVAATDRERKRIQAIGRWRGCHHCGGRMRQLVKPKGATLIGGMGYIADHMPPTKIAAKRSAVWWRKLLHIKVTQRLFPQCEPCFQRQGEAVRRNIHSLVFHYGLRPCHLALPLAIFLCDTKLCPFSTVEEFLIPIEDVVLRQYKCVADWLAKLWKG